MRNLLPFVKKNIYVIAGAFCIVVICALYFTQSEWRNEALPAGEIESTVIFDSKSGEPGSAEAADQLASNASAEAADQLAPNASVEAPDQSASNSSAETSAETNVSGTSAEPEPSSADPAAVPANIQVYITGEVAVPGVYDVPPDSRVWQVLEKAGGFTELAAEDLINLAAHVSDTQHIVVPSKDDPAVAEISPGTTPFGVASSGTVLPGTSASGADPGGQSGAGSLPGGSPETGGGTPSGENTSSSETGIQVNINTADSKLLQTLPGIGEQIASYIIEYREQSGGFKTVDEILNVPRIGAVTFDKIKDRITVGGM